MFHLSKLMLAAIPALHSTAGFVVSVKDSRLNQTINRLEPINRAFNFPNPSSNPQALPAILSPCTNNYLIQGALSSTRLSLFSDPSNILAYKKEEDLQCENLLLDHLQNKVVFINHASFYQLCLENTTIDLSESSKVLSANYFKRLSSAEKLYLEKFFFSSNTVKEITLGKNHIAIVKKGTRKEELIHQLEQELGAICKGIVSEDIDNLSWNESEELSITTIVKIDHHAQKAMILALNKIYENPILRLLLSKTHPNCIQVETEKKALTQYLSEKPKLTLINKISLVAMHSIYTLCKHLIKRHLDHKNLVKKTLTDSPQFEILAQHFEHQFAEILNLSQIKMQDQLYIDLALQQARLKTEQSISHYGVLLESRVIYQLLNKNHRMTSPW